MQQDCVAVAFLCDEAKSATITLTMEIAEVKAASAAMGDSHINLHCTCCRRHVGIQIACQKLARDRALRSREQVEFFV